ncbi:MAG TPA: hypothetical protein PLD59_10435 [Tepidisphaeraceae bacterium]|nr:hypothetical protein [Tepidisphaeraceae bacterium]
MIASLQKPSVHRHWVGVFALLMVLSVMRIAGEAAPALLQVLLTDGLLAIAWAGACVGVGGCILRDGAIKPAATGSRAWPLASRFALGAGVMSIGVLLAGLLGVMSPLLGWSFIAFGLAAVAWKHLGPRGGRFAEWRTLAVSAWMWAWVVATPAAVMLVVAPAVLPGVLWGDEPNGYDVVSYHLQIPREWYDVGQIKRLDYNVFSNFPFLTEMHFLLAMHLRGGAYAGMYLAQFMHAMFAVFTSIAVYGVLGGRAKRQAVIGAVVVLAVPWTYMVGTVAYNEAALMLYAALTVGWIWGAINPVGAPTTLMARYAPALVGGAMGGFACGVKLTAVPMVMGLTALAALMLRPRQWRAGVVMFVFAGVVASPWWIRNLVATGNPVFPQSTALLGGSGWSAAQQERWTAAHGPRDDQRSVPSRLASLRQQVLTDWKYGIALIPAAGVAMLWVGIRLRGADRGFAGLLVMVCFGQVLIWLFATHLQGRFLVLIIPLLAMLVGVACSNRAAAALGLFTAAVCSVSGVISFTEPPLERDDPNQLLPQPVARMLDPRLRACIGVTDPQAFWAFVPEQVAAAVRASDRPVGLVGDARAFWWPIESKRLHYRTVFDVERREGESLIDAWARGWPAGAIIVVDPNELRRFARTYWGLGEVPEEAVGEPQPFIAR